MSSNGTTPAVPAADVKLSPSDAIQKEPLPSDSSSTPKKDRHGSSSELSLPTRCINPASEVNSRLDTQVEVRVYPCNNSQGSGKKKFTTFTIKPEVRVVL